MFDITILQTKISSVINSTTNNQKGASFEELSRYLFKYLNGVEIQECDIHMASEEIDIVLWNAQTEDVLRPWEPVILVECKNWSQNVGSQSLDSFISKLRRRSLKTGIFVAALGVTGGFIKGDQREIGAVGIIQSALQDGIRVIVITLNDIQAITSLDDIRNLIKKRYCGLFVHKII